MTIILLLFVLGIVLLLLDLFVPGIILTALGALAFLAGVSRAFHEFGIGGGLIAFGIGAVLMAVALYIEYGILPKTRFGKKFFLQTAVEGASQLSAVDASKLTGRECVALTPLMPTGQVEIDGKRHDALSLDGHIERGARLKVTGAQNFSLIVTKIS